MTRVEGSSTPPHVGGLLSKSILDTTLHNPWRREIQKLVELLPETDRYLDRESLPALRQWAKSQMQKYCGIANAYAGIHNYILPIHSLPSKVISLIFSYTSHDRKSLRFSHVCRLWRTTMLSNAAFWADAIVDCGPLVDKDDELPFIEVLFSRSALHCGGIQPHFVGFSAKLSNVLRPYTRNLESLQVDLKAPTELSDGLWPVLIAGMPNLCSLRCVIKGNCHEEEWDIDGLSHPLHDMLPRLSRLSCPYQMLTLFKHIALQHITVTGGHGLPDYLDVTPEVLCSYVQLGTLHISDGVAWESTRDKNRQAVHLPVLRQLSIESTEEQGIVDVLSWLALPDDCHVRITRVFGSPGSSSPSSILPDLQPNSATPPRLAPWSYEFVLLNLHCVPINFDRVCITYPKGSVSCFVGDEERLRVEGNDISGEGIVEVLKTYPSIIRLEMNLAAKLELDNKLPILPNIVELDVTVSEREVLTDVLASMNAPSLTKLVIACRLENVKKEKMPWDDVQSVLNNELNCFTDLLWQHMVGASQLSHFELHLHPAMSMPPGLVPQSMYDSCLGASRHLSKAMAIRSRVYCTFGRNLLATFPNGTTTHSLKREFDVPLEVLGKRALEERDVESTERDQAKRRKGTRVTTRNSQPRRSSRLAEKEKQKHKQKQNPPQPRPVPTRSRQKAAAQSVPRSPVILKRRARHR